MYEETIDLRPYIGYLLRHWKWIVVGALIAGLLAAIATRALAPTLYQAEATAAISPSRTEVQFDPRIQTLSDYEIANGTMVARQDALVALVTSNSVLQAVLADVQDRLEPENRSLKWLRNAGTVETTGDLINLEIRHPEPDTAAFLANSWIEHYARHVNAIYSISGGSVDSQIAEQAEEARRTYETAQQALEEYQAVNPEEGLRRELEAKAAILENYQEARIAAQSRPADRNQEILSAYYQELAQIEVWLADANALRDQVAGDSNSAAANLGNALALISLRSRVFGGSQRTTVTEDTTTRVDEGPSIQLDLSSMALEQVTPADVESLIETLERRQQAAEERISRFLQGFNEEDDVAELSQVNERITSLTGEINLLNSELEAATARLRELTDTRDNSWETYQVLYSRQVEEQIASEAASSEVRIADRAIVPSEPVGRGTIRNSVVAMLLGAFLAVGVILAQAWRTVSAEPGRSSELPDDAVPESEERPEASVATTTLPDSLSS